MISTVSFVDSFRLLTSQNFAEVINRLLDGSVSGRSSLGDLMLMAAGTFYIRLLRIIKPEFLRVDRIVDNP